MRLAHEEWGAKFLEAGLLLAPATAYMSAVAEGCARIAIERAPGIDSLEILSMFNGFPTYGSTQTIFGQLQWESIYLEQNEYKLWPPVTTLEVTIPSAITTQLALPWGGFPHPVWFKDHPQIANVRAFGGLLDRSIMEGIVARPARLPGEHQGRCPPTSSAACSPRSPTRCSPASRRARTGACSARSTSSSAAAASTRSASTPTARAPTCSTGLIQAFAAHHLVHQPPRKVGFASPGEAFGHREILAALEAYGFVRVEVG